MACFAIAARSASIAALEASASLRPLSAFAVAAFEASSSFCSDARLFESSATAVSASVARSSRTFRRVSVSATLCSASPAEANAESTAACLAAISVSLPATSLSFAAVVCWSAFSSSSRLSRVERAESRSLVKRSCWIRSSAMLASF